MVRLNWPAVRGDLRWAMPICAMFMLTLAACGASGGGTGAPLIVVVPAGVATPAPTPTPSPTPTPVPTPPPTPTVSYGRVEGQPYGFNAAWYANRNPDVVAAGMDLLLHYLWHGRGEGRLPYEGAKPITAMSGEKPVIVSEGDSISVFWGGNHTGMYAAAHPDVTVHGHAVGGSGINDLNGRLEKATALKPSVVTVLIGANDLSGKPDSGVWLTALWDYVAGIRATGAKVAVGTILPICLPESPDYTTRHKAMRPDANAGIRAAVGTHIDAVMDYAADPTIGPDAAACDPKLYPDGLHPAGPAQERMFLVYARAMAGLIPN